MCLFVERVWTKWMRRYFTYFLKLQDSFNKSISLSSWIPIIDVASAQETLSSTSVNVSAASIHVTLSITNALSAKQISARSMVSCTFSIFRLSTWLSARRSHIFSESGKCSMPLLRVSSAALNLRSLFHSNKIYRIAKTTTPVPKIIPKLMCFLFWDTVRLSKII